MITPKTHITKGEHLKLKVIHSHTRITINLHYFFAQLQEAQSFNEDPLNKAKGLKYQFQYEGTLNRRLAYKLYDTLIRKDEDVSQYVYEYSLKGAKK